MVRIRRGAVRTEADSARVVEDADPYDADGKSGADSPGIGLKPIRLCVDDDNPFGRMWVKKGRFSLKFRRRAGEKDVVVKGPFCWLG